MSVAQTASLFASLQRFHIDTYLDICPFALLVYDYILTFERELTLVWGTKWNLTKILFFLTRYPPFVDSAMVLYHEVSQNVSADTCQEMFNIEGWMTLWGIGIAELILIIRTWAIWGRDKRIGVGLFASFLALWITGSYFLNNFVKSMKFVPAHTIAPQLGGCLPVAGKNVLYVDIVLIMVFETIVLGLTLVKIVHTFRWRTSSQTPLMRSLYRDGILFYIYLSAISLVNMIVLLTTPHEFANLLTALQRCLHSILSARLLLNLREASLCTTVLVDGNIVSDSTTSVGGVSDIRFGGNSYMTCHASITLFSVDDGAWVDGDRTFAEPCMSLYEARANELGPVRAELRIA